MKRVHVAVGVIRRNGQILLAKRADHLHQGGLWEFPGGKVESGESVQNALSRELYEELGIHVTASQMTPLLEVRHDYPDKQVLLDVWWVDGFSGEATGREGQPLAWVPVTALHTYDFPQANLRIVKALQLATKYLITGSADSVDQFEHRLISSLKTGCPGMVLYRQVDLLLSEEQKQRRLDVARRQCASKDVRLLISGLPEWCDLSLLDGVHLPSSVAAALSCRPLPEEKLVGVSCHNRQEMEHAIRIGADFVTLSPVLPTSSHPEQAGKGWAWFAELATLPIPVYALGGLTDEHLASALPYGACGMAAISAWWPSQ